MPNARVTSEPHMIHGNEPATSETSASAPSRTWAAATVRLPVIGPVSQTPLGRLEAGPATAPTHPRPLPYTSGGTVRIARFAHPEGLAFGTIEGEGSGATVAEVREHPFGPLDFTGRRWAFDDVRLLAPVLPTKVVAIG